MRSAVVAVALLAAACRHGAAPVATPSTAGCVTLAPPRSPPPAGADCEATVAGDVVERAFGAAFAGRLLALSDDGRRAVVVQFRRDDDGDGKIAPRFGQHGEPLGDLPRLFLCDIDGGGEEEFDQLLDVGADGHAVLLRRGSHAFVVSANGPVDLGRAGADVGVDLHSLVGHRATAAFDADGERVGFVRAAPDRGVVRALDACDEDELPASAPLWRVVPASVRGWGTLEEVPSDTNGDGAITFPLPVDATFAASIGVGTRGGDRVEHVLASRGGARIVGDAVALAPDLAFDRAGQRFVDGRGRPLPWPAGCGDVRVVDGVARVLARCDGAEVLAAPGAPPIAIAAPLPLELAGRPERDASGRSFIAARAGDAWGILGLDDGRFVAVGAGPAVVRRGRITVAERDRVVAAAVATGRRVVVRGHAAAVADLAAGFDGGWATIDPARCRATPMPARPLATSGNGCAVFAAASDGALERGPYLRRCPR